MSMDLTGITNQNEYYTNHYFSSIFEENASATIKQWRELAKNSEEKKTPWSRLREMSSLYYREHERFLRSRFETQTLISIRELADAYLNALGYPQPQPDWIQLEDNEIQVPVYLELKKPSGAPALWVLLATSKIKEEPILEKFSFSAGNTGENGEDDVSPEILTNNRNEDLVTKIFFGSKEPPRFILLIGMNQIALIDRNKWNEKRYLQFEIEEIFSRREESTLQAMAVLLHRKSLCPEEGTALIDNLDAESQKHAAGVSQDLKYALRECIERLGNEILYDMRTRQGRDLEQNPVDAGQLTIECLRYMYRMLFVLFIEARPELGYAPIQAQSYLSGYSLESLRDIADSIRADEAEVGSGYYLHETLSKLYNLIYDGYPSKEEDLLKYSKEEGLHDMFVIAPLKAHIFDPEYTPMFVQAKLRNSVMLRIIDLMSLTRESERGRNRRGRISYANLGINQLGSVYEALLSYRGFIAEQDLYEVKRKGDSFNELDVGYFVPESKLDQYTEAERVRYEDGENVGKPRMYPKGKFIYRLAGREREKSASYYTPECLTKCLVKYALKELLEGKTADEILHLTVCEPAMGSAAFLNEAINQLAEAYLDRKQAETGKMIDAKNRFTELQKVKMFIADRNIYGIDLNPVAVELAEVSLWLNTIFKEGFVPWFGTQLVTGNSLIGARRQCYRVEALTTNTQGLRWYENAPERVPLGSKRDRETQIYHFLLGDPGMCDYTDKVIKTLKPDQISLFKKWNRGFTAPWSEDDLMTLKRLSGTIDELWEEQVQLRKKVEQGTRDSLSVFEYTDNVQDSKTTIRQKDILFKELYKTEHAKNAGAYARLKFAMDYWCALWFWPIEQAELLPSRSEFLFDMSLILEGTTRTVQVNEGVRDGDGIQLLLILESDSMHQIASEFQKKYEGKGIVDIPTLLRDWPRLKLAHEIAERNRFMHWELEFADLFQERGGFDLILGNPPWIKLKWEEKNVLSEKNPMFIVKDLTVPQTVQYREEALQDETTRSLYFHEFEEINGQQTFLNAVCNYPLLKGQQTNLFKCFLPQAWMFGSEEGISAYVHPDGVYNDSNGGMLRKELYPRLRKHFQFINEKILFPGVGHPVTFSINIYSNKISESFDSIANLFEPSTIDACYEPNVSGIVGGIKDENGEWNIQGHPDRILHIGSEELKFFARVLDNSDKWQQARLPALHVQALVEVLRCFAKQKKILGNFGDEIFSTAMWHETNSQKDGTIIRNVHFPESLLALIYSGPHIGVANPFYKASRRVCIEKSDYDIIDLSIIDENYLQRCNYSPRCSLEEYVRRIPETPWRSKCYDEYRIITRTMLNLGGERTLYAAIIPPKTGLVNTTFSFAFKDIHKLVLCAGMFVSIPYDYMMKITGKGMAGWDVYEKLPFLDVSGIKVRTLLLNALTRNYSNLWERCWNSEYQEETWSKQDPRLKGERFSGLTKEWSWATPLRTDYERRQALVEIDVLVAMALGMTLEQLKTIYHIQFPVLQENEKNTWYDANGRIVFTMNRGLPGVGFERKEWEETIKGAAAGQKFSRTIEDDTQPGGPVKRTIEYVAPFDRCSREEDYETAWRFFEAKYGTQSRSETNQEER